jgi:hypothetical protein
MVDNLYLDNAPAVHLHDQEGKPAVVYIHLFPRVLREMPEPVDDKTADGLIGFVGRQRKDQGLVDLLNPHLAVNNMDARSEFLHAVLFLVELVKDVPDQFF